MKNNQKVKIAEKKIQRKNNIFESSFILFPFCL